MPQISVVVRAHAAAGSDFSKLRLLLDGVVVGEVLVHAKAPTDHLFLLDDVDPTVAHRLGVEHYHDTSARALTLESVKVGATLFAAAEGVQDVGPRDGLNLVAGAAAGRLAFNGTWEIDVPAAAFAPTPDGGDPDGGEPGPPADPNPDPAPGPTPEPTPEPTPDPGPGAGSGETVIVLTLAAAPGSDLAKFKLLVDGVVVGGAQVTSAAPTPFTFTVGGLGDGQPHEIAVEHFHDTASRALRILGVEVNGTTVDPATGVQDVGLRDGKVLVTGEAAATITFNGTWFATLPPATFAGTPPPPEPPATGAPTPYAELVADLGAVVHWRLAETTGTVAADTLGNNDAAFRNGVGLGAVGLVAGDGAVRLDGVDDYLSLASGGGQPIRLMILGDSLTTPTSPRMAASETIPGQLAPRLVEAGWNVELITQSKAGDTTVGGSARLEAYFANAANPVPDAAIVALGTNDSRNRLNLDTVESKLGGILDLLDQKEVAVLLAGSRAQWPEVGQGYPTAAQAEAFTALFADAAAAHGAAYYPDILEAVYDADPALYTSDYIHPTPAGNTLILDDLFADIEALLAPFGRAAADPLALAEGTVSLWFAADDLNGRQGLLSKDATGYGNGGDVSLFLDGSRLVLRLQDAGATHELKSAAGAVSVGEAHHVAFTFGPAGAGLWLDGVEVARSAYAGGLESNSEALILGALAWTSARGTANKITDHFDGRLDEVAVFTSQLPADAIAVLAGLEAV